jgi:hypothetical protein
MLELVSYGLTGLAALVIVASCLAYSGEFSLWGKRSIDPTDKPLGLCSRRFGERGTVSPSVGVPGESAQREALYG